MQYNDRERGSRSGRTYPERSAYRANPNEGATRPTPRRSRQSEGPKNSPVWQLIIMDILLFGVGILVFAFFHHGMPKKDVSSGRVLPTVTQTAAVQPVTDDAPATEPAETAPAETTPGETEPAETTPAETTTTVETTPAVVSVGGMFGDKFPDKFNADGSVQKTDTTYRSKNVNVTLTKIRLEEEDITYFVQDIYVRDLKYFKTAFANDKFGHSTDKTVNIAVAHNAIGAISGDYCTNHGSGIVIRNGELYRETISDMDLCVLFQDGSMKCYDRRAYNLDEIISQGALQSWNFGPRLLDDNGGVMEKFNSDVNRKNPRSAIGYFEPGHYALVTIDGRQPGYSGGMTTAEMSQLFHDMGCKAAFNLDGGQSAVMSFYDKEASQPYGGGRSICDIIYVTDED